MCLDQHDRAEIRNASLTSGAKFNVTPRSPEQQSQCDERTSKKTHHIDGFPQPLRWRALLEESAARLLQQHDALEPLSRAVRDDPATVTGTERETTLRGQNVGSKRTPTACKGSSEQVVHTLLANL